MDETKQPGLRIAQIFLSVAHFEHRKDALELSPHTPIEVPVTLHATSALSDDRTKGVITLAIVTNDEGDPLYRLRVEMVGFIEQDVSAPNLSVDEYMAKQGQGVMYPFLREAVANLTMRGRFGPLWLRPMNLTAMEQIKGETGQALTG